MLKADGNDKDMEERGGTGEHALQPGDEPSLPTFEGGMSIADAAPVSARQERRLLPFPTVAIGASAGGVDALRRLFAAMPHDIGCAFVVIMHLDPDRESMLAPLLGHVTTMPVSQAVHEVPVEVNHVYTVPPGQYLRMVEGKLLLSPLPRRRPRQMVADHFMISLAQDQRERAIAIVMTGADGDAALGVKAIKGEGGLTLVQTLESATHASMPRNALATGQIDRELTIEEMPAALRAYVEVQSAQSPSAEAAPDADKVLLEILAQVRGAGGLDFRGYKKPMLIRRVRRRMGLVGIQVMSAYLQRLKEKPKEAAALGADLLIGVTEFFREPDAWVELAKEIIPQILARKREGDSVRLWVPACATGQEAYTLAMVLLEQPRFVELGLRLQVFATDVDRRALEVARLGVYGDPISSAVSPERLSRFFMHTEGGYQVRKGLREVVLFALQNVVTDPPFSRMDLISCRNLLIYMAPELQRRALQTFHFSLDPGGFLFLGKSETAGPSAEHFAVASHAFRIYSRVGPARPGSMPPREPSWPRSTGPAWHSASASSQPDYRKLVREALLEHRLTAAVLTTPDGRVLYYYGDVLSWFGGLEGEPTADVLAMLHQALRSPLRAVMDEALNMQREVHTSASMSGHDRKEQWVRLTALPLASAGQTLLLLSFERLQGGALPEAGDGRTGPGTGEAAQPDSSRSDTAGQGPGQIDSGTAEAEGRGAEPLAFPHPDADALRALENELYLTKRELRAAIEELEATNEELKVANEEAMSVNEELQSSNEELETSKEELQSINEELGSINAELQEKVTQLQLANDDLANLLSSTHIPTLFLDRGLRIKRFTPTATRLFSLIPGDIGRPLPDIASRSDMRSLLEDARQVLAELAPMQREVTTEDGEFFLRRTLPYRTHDDRINGVVVTFTDITEIRRATEGRRQFATVVQNSTDAIIVHDLDGSVLAWNPSAEKMYGYAEAEALGMSMFSLLPEETRPGYREQVERALAGQPVQGFETPRRTREGTVIEVSASLSVVRGDDGAPSAVALIERDITHRKRADARLRASEERFRVLADSAPVLIWTTDSEGRIEFANRECVAATGQPAALLQGRRWTDLLHPDDVLRARAARVPDYGDGPADATEKQPERLEFTARLLLGDGSMRWTKTVVMPHGALSGGQVGCMIDIQSQVEAEESLRAADRRKDEFLAMLGHELRNPLAPIRNAAAVLERVGGDDARIKWVSETLVRQVEHVTRLVDDLLDISRITRGSVNLRLEPVDLREAMTRAIDVVRPLLERKRHHYETRIPDEPLWVEGDAMRLVQIFENLLTNSAKYTDEGGEIEVELLREGDRAVAHVRDNGMGIAEGMQSRVFEIFVQDERSIDRSQGGLGIGLSLVKHLAQLHGGQVEAHSRGPGEGSDFVVRLPLLRGHVSGATEQPQEGFEHHGGRILIVDDDLESTTSLALVLELGGFVVAQANDLDGALEIACSFLPQVVVLDLAMPGADGFEIKRRLHALRELSAAQFVALSGFGRAEDLARTRRAGFTHHFAKPVDPARLERVLRELLEGDAGDAGGSGAAQ